MIYVAMVAICVLIMWVFPADVKCVRCWFRGHKYVQGVPSNPKPNLHLALFCSQCGSPLTVVNSPEETDGKVKGN